MEDSERKQTKLPAEAQHREHAVYVVMVMGAVRVINGTSDGDVDRTQTAAVWSLSHLRLFCDPMDYSPPGSSVQGIWISQARILEWVAISSSKESSRHRDQTWVSCIGRWLVYH